jgi:hypothetical protein
MAIFPRRGADIAMKIAMTLTSLLLLAACASTPPPPEWKANAASAMQAFVSAQLSGNTRLADVEFKQAQSEISRTGRLDLMARAELTRCAVQVASLDWSPCTAVDAEAPNAQAEEKAYTHFLAGQWEGLNPDLLPQHYRKLVLQYQVKFAPGSPPGVENSPALLQTISDPLARLIAASVLLKRQQLSPSEWAVATETASAQGWRRPLLAWLGMALKAAYAANQTDAATALQARIDVVLQTKRKDH